MSPKTFHILLYASLALCAAGIVFKTVRWFVLPTGPRASAKSAGAKLGNAILNFFKTLASVRVLGMLRAIFIDTLLQGRIMRNDPFKWVMHFLIFGGFTMLMLFHAMDEIITLKLIKSYQSTMSPFFLLRNLFGAMVFAGALIAIVRRVVRRGPLLRTRFDDTFALVLVSTIILSGFFLDSAKIVSEAVYERMVKEYYPVLETPEDQQSLKVYWAAEYGVMFKDVVKPYDSALLAKGKEHSENGCVSCHPTVKTAFVSFPMAKSFGRLAYSLNKSRADIWIYWIHVLACFIGIAYLPFSKMFHVLSNPLTMFVNGASDKMSPDASVAETRRALEFDACVNCGTCNSRCSVAPINTILGNEYILPAQKLAGVATLARKKDLSRAELDKLGEGSFICTSCYKCTEYCPTAINLQDQWNSSRELLAEKGHPAPQTWIRDTNASGWADVLSGEPLPAEPLGGNYLKLTKASPESFSACIQCQTCTNVCPVVEANVKADNMIDVTPQKIMNLLRMGLLDLACGTRMAWDCTTCYQCQENCPQGIRVADIMYELKNAAFAGLRGIDREAAIAKKDK